MSCWFQRVLVRRIAYNSLLVVVLMSMHFRSRRTLLSVALLAVDIVSQLQHGFWEWQFVL